MLYRQRVVAFVAIAVPVHANADERASVTWRPDVALRMSWSQSYIENDGFRPLPALPVLIARVRLSCPGAPYIGLQASLGDLLAPIAELTMRPTAMMTLGGRGPELDYLHDKRLLANVIQPRVAVEVRPLARAPQLVLDVGVSMRVASPAFVYLYIPGSYYDVVPIDYRYLPNPWTDEDARIRNAVELGASIKYVP